MVVPAAGPVHMPFLALEVGFELRLGGLALGYLGLGEEEVDDLVLVQWRAQLGREHRLLLDIFEEGLAVLALILLRRLRDQPLHLLVAHLDAVRGADFRQQQAEPDAAFGDAAIFGGVLFNLRKRGIGIGFVARFVPQLAEDILVLGFDHGLREPQSHGARRADPAAGASCACG